MGVDLNGTHGETWWSISSWTQLMSMARLHGWHPHGTLEPMMWGSEGTASVEWSGSYFTNDGQWVTDEDALELAQALERALPDIPNHDAMLDREDVENAPRIDTPWTWPPGEGRSKVPLGLSFQCTAFEWFSGSGKLELINFIDFCQQGGFSIW